MYALRDEVRELKQVNVYELDVLQKYHDRVIYLIYDSQKFK